MNYITTNVRIPEEVYQEIKEEALEKKISIGAVIRERVVKKTHPKNRNTEKFMKDLKKLAKENDKQNPGISFSEKLIEMRYEQ